MFTLVTFITSIALILILVTIKNIESKSGKTFGLTNFFSRFDIQIVRAFKALRVWWSHVNFNNLKLIFSKIVVSIRKVVTMFKRRFDHKHSPFFTKKEHGKNKASVSFFLKDISDHKKSLREGREEGK
jgi:hypothetical protein